MNKALWLAALSSSFLLACDPKPAPKPDTTAAENHDGHDHGKEPRGSKEGGHDEPSGAPAHGEHGEEGEERKEAHERRVVLSPEALSAAGIQVVEATSGRLGSGLTAPARVTFTQTGVARVAPRASGRLDTIEVRLGQRVRKGTVLGYMESPELGRARGDYLAAATRERVAEANLKREKELLVKGITSEREMREAESSWASARGEVAATEAHLHALGITDEDIQALGLKEHPSARFPARSPIDGTVVEILGTLGQTVESTTHLFTVGDLATLWVLLDVFESQLPLVQVGQEVTIATAAVKDRAFGGRIDYVGEVVDERTRAVGVRVVVKNGDGVLKPGMFATATFAGGSGPSATAPRAVIIPREAVQRIGEEQVVFSPLGDGVFRAVEVQVGVESGRSIQVIAGLDAGQKVVTTGAFVLKSELSKEAMSGGHAGHGH